MSLNMVQNNYENRKYHYILDNIWNKTYIIRYMEFYLKRKLICLYMYLI